MLMEVLGFGTERNKCLRWRIENDRELPSCKFEIHFILTRNQ
jgi:hypothetical protein